MKNTRNLSYLKVLPFFEARDRSVDTAFLPDDQARSDCWPDWSTTEDDSAVLEKRVRDNSPRRVLSEVGLALAIPLLLAVVVSFLVPVP